MASARISTAFIPVSDPVRSAAWYADRFGLELNRADEWSATLRAGSDVLLTLMGPASGIAASPGLRWATCNFLVDDLELARAQMIEERLDPAPIDGDPSVCLFFTVDDPDGNTLLVTDR